MIDDDADTRKDFETWCLEHLPTLRSTGVRHSPRYGEDAVQTVLERYQSKWGNPDFSDEVKSSPGCGYAKRSVINETRSMANSENADHRRLQKWTTNNPPADSSETFAHVEEKVSADSLLDMLNPTWRSVICLRYGDGLSLADVAAHLGISESTARRYEKLAVKAFMQAERTWEEQKGQG
jgi:RNA polymerase sigma factor (sigma-70 family)